VEESGAELSRRLCVGVGKVREGARRKVAGRIGRKGGRRGGGAGEK